jgi:hypothetical protein
MVSALAYLGLAILGGGGFAVFLCELNGISQ